MRFVTWRLLRIAACTACVVHAGCLADVEEKETAVAGPPPAGGRPGAGFEAAFNSAVNHARFGRHQEAIEAYRKAIREDPTDAAAHYGLGVAYVLSGDYGDAKEVCETLGELNGVMAAKLRALAGKKEAEEKEVVSREKAVRIRPDSAAAYFRLGMAYSEHGRYPDAVEAFKQAARISPNSARIYCELGKAYSGLGNLPEAAGAFEEALDIKPDYTRAHYEMGVAMSKLGNHPEARKSYERALELDPGDTDALYLLGVTHGKLGNPERAIELLREVVRIDPGYADAYYGIGVLLLGIGDARGALEAHERLKGLDPARAENLFTMIFPASGRGR